MTRPPSTDDARVDERCYRCEQPRSRHRPGPPSPPLIPGHLGHDGPARPAICNDFQEPPDRETLIRDVFAERRSRAEYEREANALTRTLAKIETTLQQAKGGVPNG